MYEEWEKYRALALQMLRPSQRDLEHGLELHHNSFVFDAYGFLPGGGGPAPQIDQLISANASIEELKAASELFRSNTAFFENPAMRQKLRQVLDYAGVDCIFQNSGVEGNNAEDMLKRLSCHTYLVDSLPEIFERAVFPQQLEGIRSRNHKALYLTTNGVPLPPKLYSAAEALEHIAVFFRLGVRMMHLTYNRRNLIGDGCAESSDAGLSDFGRQVIAEMNRAGVIPDVAHSGQKTSLEAALCSKKPVVASHSAAGALTYHFRSKSDEVIEAIKQSGGYIGICGIPRFLSGTRNICAMLDHIEYVARKFGVDHVAIGTDRSTPLAPTEITQTMPKARAIWESYWPDPGDGGSTVTEDEFNSMTWINWPLFTVGLVQRGFTDGEIQKIIGGNVRRVAEETLA
jgi:membrane dipeptidase